jgi:CheY-like chemotaxis protein
MAVANIITIGKTSTQARDCYPFSILHNITSSSSYHSESSSSPPILQSQNQQSNYATASTTIEQTSRRRIKDSFLRRILVVDDEPDVTLTFKVGLEEYYLNNGDKRRFEVRTYNSPLEALSEFKPNFYDLILVDVYMPNMNGFQLSEKILELDANIRVCFISAADLNIEALREVYPKLSFGSFMKKPVEIEYLAKMLLAELD